MAWQCACKPRSDNEGNDERGARLDAGTQCSIASHCPAFQDKVCSIMNVEERDGGLDLSGAALIAICRLRAARALELGGRRDNVVIGSGSILKRTRARERGRLSCRRDGNSRSGDSSAEAGEWLEG